MSDQSYRSHERECWLLFCVSILLLKLALFAVDPTPKLLLGDSWSYIQTALTDWIPEARSYFYGYVIRWSSVWTRSLTSLLVLQLLISAAVAVGSALICRFVFGLSARWSFVMGFLCALDPLQLLYERYVMTETISLGLYVFVLYQSFLYLRGRRFRNLVLVQVASVLLIGFRMSYLLLVQLDTVLLPVIAFAPAVWRTFRHRFDRAIVARTFGRLGSHLLISVILMFALHEGYKRTNGWISHRPPAYLHASGIIQLAILSPVLEPADSPDPGLADVIRKGDEFHLKDLNFRDQQRFGPGYLIDRFSTVHPERSGAERIARETAMNALRRNPLAVLNLGWRVYSDYWSVAAMKASARSDFGFNNPPKEDLLNLLASRFHLAIDAKNQTESFLQQWSVAAWPYYFLILLAPLPAAFAVAFRPTRKYAFLLFIHITVTLLVSTIFGGHTVRYLQPISFATLLVIAVYIGRFIEPHQSVADSRPRMPDAESIAQRMPEGDGSTTFVS
jgi:hypothetical protein